MFLFITWRVILQMNLRHNMAIIFCDFFISRNVCISLWLCGLRHWSCKPQILSLNPLESFVKCYRNRIIFQYFPQIYLFYFLDISMYIYYIFHYKTNSFSLKKLHREKKPSLLNGYLSSLMTVVHWILILEAFPKHYSLKLSLKLENTEKSSCKMGYIAYLEMVKVREIPSFCPKANFHGIIPPSRRIQFK